MSEDLDMLRAEASLAAQKATLAGVRTHSLGSAQENPPIDSVPFGRVKTDTPIWDALVVRRLLLALEAKQCPGLALELLDHIDIFLSCGF